MKKFILILLITVFSQLYSGPIFAEGSVLVWPIFQNIEADQQGTELWLENRGNQSVHMQVRILSWHQDNGKDRYADQSNIIASPPFATIMPKQRQLIRLIRVTAPPISGEQAFRIILDELPDTAVPAERSGAGLVLQMRYVLPLFTYASGVWTQQRLDRPGRSSRVTEPRLNWSLVDVNGKHILQIHNSGNVHARLTNVYWSSSSASEKGKLQLAKGLLGYILPGQSMRFALPSGRSIPSGAKLYAHIAENGPPVEINK